MKFLVVYNSEKINGKATAEKVEELLKANAETVICEFSDCFSGNCNTADLFKSVNAVITIGGDGTILKIAKSAAMHNCPILGVNVGRLGYLASVEGDNLDSLKKLLSGDFTTEYRSMIKVEKLKDDQVIDCCDCLNDAVISKNSLSNVIDITVKVGIDTVTYRADGIIAATPTGSTAYSLSAGGPVVAPNLDCLVLTPVCPHTLVARSVVLDLSKPVYISVASGENTSISLSSDGRRAFGLEPNTVLRISRSELKAEFIKLSEISVYKIFSQKTDNY